jgi:hypothetical protein
MKTYNLGILIFWLAISYVHAIHFRSNSVIQPPIRNDAYGRINNLAAFSFGNHIFTYLLL